MKQFDDLIRNRLRGSLDAIASLREQSEAIVRIIRTIRTALDAGGTIYTCGNGGSAAEALHLAEELIGRYRHDRPPLRAVCLCADPTALTCIANDFGFDAVFSRQLDALIRPGDVLIAFSTSGQSANIIAALESARSHGATAVGLLGKTGGAALPLCDLALVIASDDTAHIQEAHQVVLHLLLEAIESSAT